MKPIITLLLLSAMVPLSAQDDKLAAQQFALCGACHGQNGEGTGLAPPLAGSEWVNGSVETLIRIQLRGIQGPITVKGVEYSYAAGMPALAYQKDEEIASVLTYIRKSFGNNSSAVTPAEVAALRGEVGKPILNAPDVQPQGTVASKVVSSKYAALKSESSAPKWIISAFGVGITALLAIGILHRPS